MLRRHTVCIWLVAGAYFQALPPTTLHADDSMPTSRITGTVSDRATDGPVASATVELVGFGRTTQIGTDGSYAFTGLRPGVYALRASFPGYRSLLQASVMLNENQTYVLKFELEETPVQLDAFVIHVARRPSVVPVAGTYFDPTCQPRRAIVDRSSRLTETEIEALLALEVGFVRPRPPYAGGIQRGRVLDTAGAEVDSAGLTHPPDSR